MEPELDELPLLRENTEVDSFDCCDPIVDGWTTLLGKGKKIFFEELFKNDVEGRDEKNFIQEKEKLKARGRGKGKGKDKAKDKHGELKDIVEAGFKNMSEIMARTHESINGKLETLGKRVGSLEDFVGYNNADEVDARRRAGEEEEKRKAKEEEAKRLADEEEAERQEEEAFRKQQEEEEEAVRKQQQQQGEEEALTQEQEDGGGTAEDVEVEEVVTEDVEVEEVVTKAGNRKKRGRSSCSSSYKPPVTRASKHQKK